MQEDVDGPARGHVEFWLPQYHPEYPKVLRYYFQAVKIMVWVWSCLSMVHLDREPQHLCVLRHRNACCISVGLLFSVGQRISSSSFPLVRAVRPSIFCPDT
jgi:hypothetical protein